MLIGQLNQLSTLISWALTRAHELQVMLIGQRKQLSWLGAYTGPRAAGNADWSMKTALYSDW